ncbi:unnamed protein product [Closterium sp. NIES-54]
MGRPQVLATASGSGPESASCSCRLLSHQTLLWHHRLSHPSLPRLRGMASRVLVSGLPRSLPPLPPGPAPTCVPCVEGRQRAAPHSSEFPPTEAPLQTLHMDGAGAGTAGAGGTTGAGAPAGSPGAVPAGSGGASRPRPYFVPLLEQVLGLPPSPSPAPPLECPQPVQSQSLLQPVSPLSAPSPYTGPTEGLAERRAPASRPASFSEYIPI